MDKIGLVRFLSTKSNISIRSAQRSNYDNTKIHFNVEQLTIPTHKTPPQNHPISWSFSHSDCNIAEVESRAGKPALPRRSNAADCNGKEKDYESGFHYYGARYYWSELLTSWLSVDPMADKYPSMNPYAYCAWDPVKLIDPDGNDWYQKVNDYYWSDKVVSKNTTPEGCKYIGNDNSLYRHFGFPTNSVSQSLETSQTVQTLIGTNTESNNPYEPKCTASGTARAIAKTSIGYSIQKDENTGKLKGLSIHAKLETTVSDIGAGGYAAAILKVSCRDFDCSETFREKEGPAWKSIDGCTHKHLNASVTVSARKLSANCFSKLQIKGYWFSNNRPMTIPFTLGIAPSRFKHTYINK